MLHIKMPIINFKNLRLSKKMQEHNFLSIRESKSKNTSNTT